MVSAWAKDNRLVLGQKKVDEKSNEITAIPELVSRLDITGCVVTVDALNTQTHLADVLVEAGADYIFAVKANQERLMKIYTCCLRALSRPIMKR
jgi:predicted transposase YbfD/YdcC